MTGSTPPNTIILVSKIQKKRMERGGEKPAGPRRPEGRAFQAEFPTDAVALCPEAAESTERLSLDRTPAEVCLPAVQLGADVLVADSTRCGAKSLLTKPLPLCSHETYLKAYFHHEYLAPKEEH